MGWNKFSRLLSLINVKRTAQRQVKKNRACKTPGWQNKRPWRMLQRQHKTQGRERRGEEVGKTEDEEGGMAGGSSA